MSHRKYLYGLAALLLAVSAVRAAPPLAVKANPQPPVTCDEPAVPSGPFTGAFNAIYTTGFEASDGWDLGFSICGFEFAACVGNVSVGNVCTPKAGVLVNGNCCDKDPNVDTGWFYNGLARHCNQPHIDNVHPASGAQHLRAQFDPAGGQPPGCTGFTGGCRQRWSSPWDRNQPEINQTTLKYDVAFSHGYIGSNTYVRQYFGNLVNGGGIFVHAYVYFDAAGYVLQVDAGTGAAAPLGYWTYDSPDYAHVTVEYDPCNNIINYKYAGKPNIYYPGVCTPGTEPCGLGIAYGVCTPTGGETCLQGGDPCPDPADTCEGAATCPGTAVCVGGGIATFSEPFSFTPPYGDYCNYSGANCIGSHADPNPAYLDSFTWGQTNRNDGEMIDIDNFSITHVNCPDACCNGDTGVCLDTLSAAECAALAHGHFFPNVQCAQLGTPGFPPACGIDRGSCCDAGPGSGGSCTDGVLEADCQPPQKTWHRGAACEEYSTLCAVGHGMCSSGPGLDGAPPGKAPYHCITDPTRECVTNDDCTNPGFCYGGLCSPAAVPGHCEYSSAGFCQNMGRCSGSAACDPSTGDGCCDLTCATPVTCPGTQTCEAEPQQCNAVPGGADCAFCEGCDAWPTVACSNIGQGGECPSPGIGILPGTCVANSLYVCNGDADCPEGSSGGDCVFPAVSPGGFLCTSNDDCVIPATQCGPEHLGACCHGTTGGCDDNVLSANCTGDQVVWTKLGVCATLDPPCVQHTGACCDASPKADHCTDGIHPQACVGPNQTWFKGTLCAVAQCPAVVLGACCNTLAGTCTNNETAATCGDTNPLPKTDQRVFTLDGTCANVPCAAFHCGPGEHWIDDCPPGTDYLDGTQVLVGIDLDLDPLCLADTALILSGDAVILRGEGSPHSMTTELVSMTVSGDGATLRVGVPLPRSFGKIVEKGDPSIGHSYFDVYFEIDRGADPNQYLYNQTPVRVEAQLTKVPPKAVDYIHLLTDCLPLYTSPTPGTGILVANLTYGAHGVGKEVRTGACCDGVTGTCRNGVELGDCFGEQQVFHLNKTCTDLDPPCAEHTGACCDQDTFGSCQENVPGSQCDCKKCLFYKDTPCSEIECVHNPIPTVSAWGLAILTLLLLVGAKVYFGRRQSAAA